MQGRRRSSPVPALSALQFLAALRWIDGSALLGHVEPYRQRLFTEFFDSRDDTGRHRYNLGLFGRAKKNWKTADLVLACFYALISESAGGNQVYMLANDEAQANDDLELAKKLRTANPLLADLTKVRKHVIERKDNSGFIEVLPAQDAVGQHGKTYRLLAIDEIHGYRNWDLLEALALDPSRSDSQQWISSYASLHHKPGVPLFDMMQRGKTGTDARMLFSWYGGDYTTDADFATCAPEQRANPSMVSWNNDGYLEQQRRRLPAHKYRRLHLNLPGLPEGSAFQPEPVMDSIGRGVTTRSPQRGISYCAFVDMSGGSSDDAVLAIGHTDANGCVVLDCLMNQGAPAPFDPRNAVERFVRVLDEFHVTTVTGDSYAGETFRFDFQNAGVSYLVSESNKSALYEALEPLLNGRRVVLLDVPVLEQQLLGLIWRGGRIDHPGGEHDDWANAAAGVAAVLTAGATLGPLDEWVVQANRDAPPVSSTVFVSGYGHQRVESISDVMCSSFGGDSSIGDWNNW